MKKQYYNLAIASDAVVDDLNAGLEAGVLVDTSSFRVRALLETVLNGAQRDGWAVPRRYNSSRAVRRIQARLKNK